MSDLISVLMPVYNVAPYVAEAIESILRQSYSNFEFVIVDDCSTDDTFSICKKYAEQDNRIVLIHNEQNLKIEGSLNKGLEYCHGKYIVRMDGDDISIPDRLERMKNYLEEHKEFALVGTSTQTIDSEGKPLGSTYFLNDWNLILRTCTLRTPVVHIWMTYKSVYDELYGYRRFCGSEDYDFILRLISSGKKCTNISDYYGYKIRVNRIGNSGTSFGVQKIKSAKYVVRLYKQRIKKGFDGYSYENCLRATKTFAFSEKLFSLSRTFLYKAIAYRERKIWLLVVLFTLMSFISPYQALYVFNSLRYRILSGAKK